MRYHAPASQPLARVVSEALMIELYQFDFSPYCIKVRAVLNVKQVPYRTIEILPLITQHKVRRLTGQSKVPVLKDGQTVITDSSEIALYLDTTWPHPRLIPEDPALARACFLWEDWADEALVPPIRALAFASVVEEPRLGREQLPPFGNLALDLTLPHMVPFVTRAMIRMYGISKAQIAAAPARIERYLTFLTESVADREFLVGDSLSMADITVASVTRNIDTIPSLRHKAPFAPFFAWRDRTLGRCMIPT